MSHQIAPDSVQLIRNANIKLVEVEGSANQHRTIDMIVNGGEASHRFNHKSRYAQALYTTPISQIQDRLDGGTYMTAGSSVVDFRPADYNGFVQSEPAFRKLVEVLGVNAGIGKSHRRSTRGTNAINPDFDLSCNWSQRDIEVPGYKQGGLFTSGLKFRWNPFAKNINTLFEIVRLLCTNGMMGTSSLINASVPIENRWEEHLDIAATQIQNKLSTMMPARFAQMGDTAATINDLNRLVDHAEARRELSVDGDTTRALTQLLRAIDPKQQLSSVYTADAIEDVRMAAQLPSHLSMYDVYNVCTELSTHYTATPKSSDLALDKMANELVFSRLGDNANSQLVTQSVDSALSNPEQAFFAEVA